MYLFLWTIALLTVADLVAIGHAITNGPSGKHRIELTGKILLTFLLALWAIHLIVQYHL